MSEMFFHEPSIDGKSMIKCITNSNSKNGPGCGFHTTNPIHEDKIPLHKHAIQTTGNPNQRLEDTRDAKNKTDH